MHSHCYAAISTMVLRLSHLAKRKLCAQESLPISPTPGPSVSILLPMSRNLCPASFTQHNALSVHPCCSLCQNSLPPCGLSHSLFKHFFPILNWDVFIGLRERKRERQRERNIDVRNINWSPSVHTLTRDRTRSLGVCSDRELSSQSLVYGLALHPAEPPSQGRIHSWRSTVLHYLIAHG